jgi:hypothetical protein
MVGGERDIVTTGAIVITAAIGTDAGQRARLSRLSIGVNSEKPRQAQVGSITRLGYASGALARVADDLRQRKGKSIDQPASPGLRQHR